MSVRKRSWKAPSGETKEAWIVDYSDQQGARHLKTFARKRDADAYHAVVKVDVRAGIHTADSKSLTIAEAGWRWIESGEAAKLERTTLEQYRQHLTLHIAPEDRHREAGAIGRLPWCAHLRTGCGRAGPPAMVRKVIGSLSSDPCRRARAGGGRPERGAQSAHPTPPR